MKSGLSRNDGRFATSFGRLKWLCRKPRAASSRRSLGERDLRLLREEYDSVLLMLQMIAENEMEAKLASLSHGLAEEQAPPLSSSLERAAEAATLLAQIESLEKRLDCLLGQLDWFQDVEA